MIRLERVNQNNLLHYRDVRLRALADAPSAFGSTFAHESQFTLADWFQRVASWDGTRAAGFLAFDEALCCGLAGVTLDVQDPTRATLISMWTTPTHRRQGVARALINAVLTMAHQFGATHLYLTVTSTNDPAMRFYESLGFTFTGHTEPYPNDPALIEYEMSRPISSTPKSSIPASKQ